MEKNFYKELGLEKNATKSEIKSSYRSLVKRHHPDAGGEKERFLAIQNAWETLNAVSYTHLTLPTSDLV